MDPVGASSEVPVVGARDELNDRQAPAPVSVSKGCSARRPRSVRLPWLGGWSSSAARDRTAKEVHPEEGADGEVKTLKS